MPKPRYPQGYRRLYTLSNGGGRGMSCWGRMLRCSVAGENDCIAGGLFFDEILYYIWGEQIVKQNAGLPEQRRNMIADGAGAV